MDGDGVAGTTASPHTTLQLVAGCFTEARSLRQFLEWLGRLGGVLAIKPAGFVHGTLTLEVTCASASELQRQLEAAPGLRVQRTGASHGRVVMVIKGPLAGDNANV